MLRTQFGRAKQKKKVCKVCKSEFETSQPMAIVCGTLCAIEHAKSQREAAQKRFAKLDRAETKKRKAALKSRSDWMRETQTEFNRMIKLRDRLAGWPCVSSGRPLDWSGNAVDAGHWLSVGASPQNRFNEDNVWAQSKHDNRYLGGNAAMFRIELLKRIGIERVEAIETNQTFPKWNIESLKEMKAGYRKRANDMQKQIEERGY